MHLKLCKNFCGLILLLLENYSLVYRQKCLRLGKSVANALVTNEHTFIELRKLNGYFLIQHKKFNIIILK